MRVVRPALFAAGVALVVYLVLRVGTPSIVEALSRLTWWQFALLCLPHGAVMAVDTLGWLLASIGFHLAGWMLGAVEAFIILYFLQVPLSLATAVVVEAFGAGVRFATFLVPASIGALEGANAGAFAGLGVGAGAGLAFSFVRRARQAVWVALGLMILVAMRLRRRGRVRGCPGREFPAGAAWPGVGRARPGAVYRHAARSLDRIFTVRRRRRSSRSAAAGRRRAATALPSGAWR